MLKTVPFLALKRDPRRADRTYRMPTNKMDLVLAKSAATNRGSKALQLAKQAARNESVKTAADKQFDAIVKTVAGSVTAGGKAALSRGFATRKNRLLAVELARQIGGTYSRAVIAGDRYWVVWRDETPFEVFPPLPKGIGPVAERRELQNYQGRRIDPSADSS
jgi:hypothetical protein